MQDNKLKWFQYRILHRILGTNSLLNKIKIAENPMCRLCGLKIETIKHLFVECPLSKALWKNVDDWVQFSVSIQLNLTPPIILLGYIDPHIDAIPLNAILIAVKYYIFCNAKSRKQLNIFSCQNFIKKIYHEQESLSHSIGQNVKFKNKWAKISPMLLND